MRIQMRGLGEGDRLSYWFRKYRGSGVTDGWIKLTQRDYKEDREEVDSYASISYDFARLIEPESCRLVALRERAVAPESDLAEGWLQFVGDPGIQLPPNDLDGRREGRVRTLRALSADLVWLELLTPDFRLVQQGLTRRERLDEEKQVKRVVFGLHPETRRPQLVIVAPTAEAALQVPGTTLVQTTDWFELGPERTRASPASSSSTRPPARRRLPAASGSIPRRGPTSSPSTGAPSTRPSCPATSRQRTESGGARRGRAGGDSPTLLWRSAEIPGAPPRRAGRSGARRPSGTGSTSLASGLPPAPPRQR